MIRILEQLGFGRSVAKRDSQPQQFGNVAKCEWVDGVDSLANTSGVPMDAGPPG